MTVTQPMLLPDTIPVMLAVGTEPRPVGTAQHGQTREVVICDE